MVCSSAQGKAPSEPHSGALLSLLRPPDRLAAPARAITTHENVDLETAYPFGRPTLRGA